MYIYTQTQSIIPPDGRGWLEIIMRLFFLLVSSPKRQIRKKKALKNKINKVNINRLNFKSLLKIYLLRCSHLYILSTVPNFRPYFRSKKRQSLLSCLCFL